MKKQISLCCVTLMVILALILGGCGGGGKTTTTADSPALAKVRIWLTLSDNPDDTAVTIMTPEQSLQASIWAKGITQENLTFKLNLNHKGSFDTLANDVKTEGSNKAVIVGGFANTLETGDYTFQALSGAFGDVIGSLDFKVASSVTTTLTTVSSSTIIPTPTSTLSEQPDMVTFAEYFADMGLGRIPAGGQMPNDLEEDVTVFFTGDDICLYGTVILEVEMTAEFYNTGTGETIITGSPPGFLAMGGFASSNIIDIASGKYEYKVYASGILVAVFPFEVR